MFQLAIIVAIILLLDHYSFDYAVLGTFAKGLKSLVAATVQLCSQYFRVGILTDPVLQVGLMIIYVYIVCLLIFYLLRITIGVIVDLVGSSNFLWLRSTIARERGICGLPRLAAAGKDQARHHSAGTMGGDLCVAGRQ